MATVYVSDEAVNENFYTTPPFLDELLRRESLKMAFRSRRKRYKKVIEDEVCSNGYECGECRKCHKMSYASMLSKCLIDMRREGRMCDADITAGDGTKISVHSWIMAAVSRSYYNVLFRRGNWKANLNEKNVSAKVLEIFVDFVYTGHANLSEDTVGDVLSLAIRKNVRSLSGLCDLYMQENVSLANCVKYLYLARKHNMICLEAVARHYVLRNFSEVYKTNGDFVKMLKFEDLNCLLADDRLDVVREEELLPVIVQWINYDHPKRHWAIGELLANLRLGLSLCTNLALNASLNFLQQKSRCVAHYYRTRVPKSLLFTIGGWSSGTATYNIEVFDAKAGIWVVSPHIDSMSRAYHGMAVLDGLIYVVGGYNGIECYRSVRKFNPIIGAWFECNAMAECRCYVSAVVLNEKLYALGGYNGNNRHSSCERYDPSTNQWTFIANMTEVRSDASAANHMGKIYICGGFNGERVLNSAECYDADVDQWTLFEPLPNPRSGHELVSYKCHLYALGGFNGYDRMRTVYRYSEFREMWCELGSMISIRSNFASSVLEGLLYVIGGFNGGKIIKRTEYFDDEDGTWKPSSSMNERRSALCACVIEGIPNALRYSANGPNGKRRLRNCASEIVSLPYA